MKIINIKNKLTTEKFFDKIINDLYRGNNLINITNEIKNIFSDKSAKTSVRDNLINQFQFKFNKNKFDYRTHIKPIGTNNLKKSKLFKKTMKKKSV